MLKYVSKIAMDILPSVAATIIGAYIVNHYIVARPASDAPAAAAVSSVNPKKVTAKADSKPAEISHLPEAGVRAKGISEKAISEKAASEKAASEKAASEKAASEKVASEKVASEKAASEKASLEKPAAEKPTEKSADRPSETASIPADPRRHQAGPREKTAAKTVPAPAVVPAAVATPDVATPNTAPPVEAAIAPEDRVNANEIARVTLERLRGTNEGSTHTMEASRTPDPPRLVSNPPAAAPAVRPLPPPIMVSTPGNDSFDAAPGSSRNPPYAAAAPADDPRRPTPPADIPTAPPLDLRAEAVEPPPAHTNVAEDMLSSMKSVFHAVLPKPSPD
jgi:hypothetical protein